MGNKESPCHLEFNEGPGGKLKCKHCGGFSGKKNATRQNKHLRQCREYRAKIGDFNDPMTNMSDIAASTQSSTASVAVLSVGPSISVVGADASFQPRMNQFLDTKPRTRTI